MWRRLLIMKILTANYISSRLIIPDEIKISLDDGWVDAQFNNVTWEDFNDYKSISYRELKTVRARFTLETSFSYYDPKDYEVSKYKAAEMMHNEIYYKIKSDLKYLEYKMHHCDRKVSLKILDDLIQSFE